MNDDPVMLAVADAMKENGYVMTSYDYRPGAETLIASLRKRGLEIRQAESPQDVKPSET